VSQQSNSSIINSNTSITGIIGQCLSQYCHAADNYDSSPDGGVMIERRCYADRIIAGVADQLTSSQGRQNELPAKTSTASQEPPLLIITKNYSTVFNTVL